MVSSMVQPRLLAVLTEQLYYDEIAIPFTRMQNECKQLISLLAEVHVDLHDRLNCSVFTIDQANELVILHLTHLPQNQPNHKEFSSSGRTMSSPFWINRPFTLCLKTTTINTHLAN